MRNRDDDQEEVTTRHHDAVAVISFSSELDGTMTHKGAALLQCGIAQAVEKDSVKAIVLTDAVQVAFIRHAYLD